MKGFIEVHNQTGFVMLNINAIEQVHGSTIYLRTSTAHFENDYPRIKCRESYDEIKRLIQEATNG